MSRTPAAIGAALAVIAIAAGAAPAAADDYEDLAAAEDLVALVEHVAAEQTLDGALDSTDERESELVMGAGGDSAEVLLGADVAVSLPVGQDARAGLLATGDKAVVTEDDGAFVALEKDDGSVQVVFSIVDAASATHYPFEVQAPDGAQWVTMDDGAVLLLDEEGSIVVGAAAPWAVDATGAAVATRFELTDGVLTQVVDHRAQGVTYPVVADPWLGADLFERVWNDTYRSDLRVNIRKSTWGQAMHLPSPDKWAIFSTAGWNEVKDKSPRVTEKATLQQQYECHVAGGCFNIAGDWNLEKFRPNRTALAGWGWLVTSHRCNWLTASGGERG